METDITFW